MATVNQLRRKINKLLREHPEVGNFQVVIPQDHIYVANVSDALIVKVSAVRNRWIELEGILGGSIKDISECNAVYLD